MFKYLSSSVGLCQVVCYFPHTVVFEPVHTTNTLSIEVWSSGEPPHEYFRQQELMINGDDQHPHQSADNSPIFAFITAQCMQSHMQTADIIPPSLPPRWSPVSRLLLEFCQKFMRWVNRRGNGWGVPIYGVKLPWTVGSLQGVNCCQMGSASHRVNDTFVSQSFSLVQCTILRHLEPGIIDHQGPSCRVRSWHLRGASFTWQWPKVIVIIVQRLYSPL